MKRDLSKPKNPRRQCWGKVKHRSRTTANGHAMELGPDYSVYACPWCGHWHVGHSKETLVMTVHIPARPSKP